MPKIDLKLNPPKDKRALTLDNMLSFVEKYGTNEDCEWFADLLDANTVKKANNLKGGEPIDGYNYTPIREEFAKRFFPEISAEAKKKNKTKAPKKPSNKTRIANLRNRK